MMKRTRRTPEQIVTKLREAVAQVMQALGVMLQDVLRGNL